MRMRDVKSILYPKWDSNPHIFRYCILSATRLPIPPFGLGTWSILHEISELPNNTAYCGHVEYVIGKYAIATNEGSLCRKTKQHIRYALWWLKTKRLFV